MTGPFSCVLASVPEMSGKRSVLWIMFLAFSVTHLIFAGIGYTLNLDAEPMPDGETMAIAFAVVSVMEIGFIFTFIPAKFSRDYQTLCILRFALAESISIYGLVLAMMGLDITWCIPFWAVGLATHLTTAPTDRDYEAAQRRAKGS